MKQFFQGFSLLHLVALKLLLLVVFCLSVASLPAIASSLSPTLQGYYLADLTEGDAQIPQERKKRIEAIEECKHYRNGDNSTSVQVNEPLDKSGSKKLVGALKSSNNPDPTPAELAFKRCLEEKGIVPKP